MSGTRSARRGGEGGFTIVEVVVSMLLLGVVAMVVLPVLVTGLRLAQTQSETALAVRAAASVVEEARSAKDCAALNALGAPHTVPDGHGGKLTVTPTVGRCAHGTAVALAVVVSRGLTPLARTSALIYIP